VYAGVRQRLFKGVGYLRPVTAVEQRQTTGVQHEKDVQGCIGNGYDRGGIQKSSLIDYPGKVSCVIFMSGC
jgi:hypothetical protein